MTDADAAVDQAADELYGLTLERFTERRNELAKALRKEGDRSAADAIKALRKPNQTAWALNQVARRRAGDVERLLETGATLRRTQEGVLSGDDPRSLAAASEEERRVVSDLVTAAASIAAECGVGATDSLRERVRSTLEAAVRDEDVGEALRAGRLVGDHQAVGLLDLAAWRPSPESPTKTRKAEGSTKQGEPERKSEVPAKRREADRRKAAREKREAEQLKRIEEARGRLEAARQRQGSVEERLEEATRAAKEARERAERAIAEAERAEETQRATQGELEEADAQVRGLAEELGRAERTEG